ncbi:hypothetical protein [Ensifer adhaerens]|uniref:hypothetical protein n=1 Tax=Ensifer adhaerens TaxID=106592 RepID=UPI003D04B77A
MFLTFEYRSNSILVVEMSNEVRSDHVLMDILGRFVEWGLVTSVGTTSTSARSRHRTATGWNAEAFRAVISSLALWRENASAFACPIPDDAAVITTTGRFLFSFSVASFT